jgi:hypothetical protein
VAWSTQNKDPIPFPFLNGFKHCIIKQHFNRDMTIGTEQKPKKEIVLFSMPLLLLQEANIDHTEDTSSFKKSTPPYIFSDKS